VLSLLFRAFVRQGVLPDAQMRPPEGGRYIDVSALKWMGYGYWLLIRELTDCGLLCADFEANKKSSTLIQKITQVVVCVDISRPRRN
jgi:hypothetical protein